MKNSSVSARIGFKYGLLENVLGGQASSLSSLSSPSALNAILKGNCTSPKAIGVYQEGVRGTQETKGFGMVTGGIEDASQSWLTKQYGSPDNFPLTLIALIYHGSLFLEEDIRGKIPSDPLRRVRLLPYTPNDGEVIHLPPFLKKPLMNLDVHQLTHAALGPSSEFDRDYLVALGRQYRENHQTYGLTRIEYILAQFVSSALQRPPSFPYHYPETGRLLAALSLLETHNLVISHNQNLPADTTS